MTKTAEKPLPFGAAHTYIAHRREYPPRGINQAESVTSYVSPLPVKPTSQQEDLLCFVIHAINNKNAFN